MGLPARDKNGCTPLHWGIGDPETAKLLIDNGADVNAKDKEGDTPLHHAGRHSYMLRNAAELLLSRGADVNARNDEGVTPLDVAIEKWSNVHHKKDKEDWDKGIRLLLAHGAKSAVRTLPPGWGESP